MTVMPQQFFLYKDTSGRIQINALFRDETLWLTHKAMAELFEVERSVITKHIGNIYKERELQEKTVSANFAHTAADGKNYNTAFYNLDMIIAVGYRDFAEYAKYRERTRPLEQQEWHQEYLLDIKELEKIEKEIKNKNDG